MEIKRVSDYVENYDAHMIVLLKAARAIAFTPTSILPRH